MTPSLVIPISSSRILLRMQPALGLGAPAPAAGAFVLAERDGPRAGPAADAGISLVVQRVIRHVVLGDEAPHLLLRPVRQGTDFHEAEFFVPANDRDMRSIGTLVAADRAGPGL